MTEKWRYDGKRAVVTGCASGIGEQVAIQLDQLGAEVVGLDVKKPSAPVADFHEVDLADPASIDKVVAVLDGPVDALFNVAGVSSGVGSVEKVMKINFLGMRYLTESLLPKLHSGSAVAAVSSLAAQDYREHFDTVSELLATTSVDEGWAWCERNPDELRGGGYHISKEAVALYVMSKVNEYGARGVRLNCIGPHVTKTPFLNDALNAYGEEFLDNIPKPIGRVATAEDQANALIFLNSDAASYVHGHLLWVDGGYAGGVATGVVEPM